MDTVDRLPAIEKFRQLKAAIPLHGHKEWKGQRDVFHDDATLNARGVIAVKDQLRDPEAGAVRIRGRGHYHETYRREPDGWSILTSRRMRLHVHVAGENG